METGTIVSVEEYLNTSYRPDCDYTEGIVEERNVGERDHSFLQTRFWYLFEMRRRESGLVPYVEFRVRVRSDKYRIPDVLVCRGVPDEQILTTPPLLCIEVMSPSDRVTRVNHRVREYLDFGVPVVWVVDPAEKTIWIYRTNGFQEVTEGSIRVDGTNIDLSLSEIFDPNL